MYKSTHEAHDYMERVANHSTKGSRRGFAPDVHNGFHRSMSSDHVQSKAQLILAIARVKEDRLAALLAWRPCGATKMERRRYLSRAKKKRGYTPIGLCPKGIAAFKEWLRLGVLEQSHVIKIQQIKAEMRVL